jgi:hypothetical protein
MVLIEGADRFGFVSPWRNIKPVKQKKSDVDPFTLDEVNRFLETVRPDMRNYYTVRFFAGLRSSCAFVPWAWRRSFMRARITTPNLPCRGGLIGPLCSLISRRCS